MSWNGSNSVGSAPRADRNSQTPPNRGSGDRPARPFESRRTKHAARSTLLAVLLLLALASAALWWFFGRDEARPLSTNDQPITKTNNIHIAQVKPSIRPKSIPKKKDPPGYYNGKKISESNRPPWMSPYHRIIDYGPIHTNKPREKTLIERTFEKPSDQQIADLLDTEPGTMFFGDCEDLYQHFTRNFLKSIQTPIIVKADDSDEVKELKQAVIKARLELKDRYDRGEDLNKFMKDSRNALKELGLYKDELNRQLESIAKDNVLTEQEAADYVKAANKMLEERGCSSLGNTEFLVGHLYRRSKAFDKLRKIKEDKK